MIQKKIYPEECISGNSRLLLFFAGWGMDETPFLDYSFPDSDFIICYDYHSLDFSVENLRIYSEIKVVAWSMGVWAASMALAGKELPIRESIAVNGTPWPVDDERGIPVSIFKGTLGSLDERGLCKFRRRICGSPDLLRQFMEKIPKRSLEDLRSELQAVEKMTVASAPVSFVWDKAYVGMKDKIFPPGNQQKAWEGTTTILVDEEHYLSKELWDNLMTNPLHSTEIII